MKNTSKQGWRFALMISVVLAVLFLIYNNIHLREKLEESNNNIEALTDTLSVTRNKDSSQTARIMAFETQSAKDFLKIQSQEADIIRLQNLIRNNKSMMKPGASATVLSTETNVNTKTPTIVYSRDTIYQDNLVYLYPEYKSEINLSNWITGTSISNKDTTTLNLKVRNDYDVVIGDDRDHIFQKYKPYAEVTSHNPYTDIKTVRTHRVSVPAPKMMGVGVHIGYGMTLQQRPVWTPVISVGVNFNLFEF